MAFVAVKERYPLPTRGGGGRGGFGGSRGSRGYSERRGQTRSSSACGSSGGPKGVMSVGGTGDVVHRQQMRFENSIENEVGFMNALRSLYKAELQAAGSSKGAAQSDSQIPPRAAQDARDRGEIGDDAASADEADDILPRRSGEIDGQIAGQIAEQHADGGHGSAVQRGGVDGAAFHGDGGLGEGIGDEYHGSDDAEVTTLEGKRFEDQGVVDGQMTRDGPGVEAGKPVEADEIGEASMSPRSMLRPWLRASSFALESGESPTEMWTYCQIQQLLQLSAFDWHQAERRIQAEHAFSRTPETDHRAWDVLWHARFISHFGDCEYERCGGRWKERFTQALVLPLISGELRDWRFRQLVLEHRDYLQSAVGSMDCSGLCVDDDGVSALVHFCPAMHRLNLARTQVGDAGVEAVAIACAQLSWIRLTGTEVSDEGVHVLLSLRPKLTIVV